MGDTLDEIRGQHHAIFVEPATDNVGDLARGFLDARSALLRPPRTSRT
jgi:hypothetical protein